MSNCEIVQTKGRIAQLNKVENGSTLIWIALGLWEVFSGSTLEGLAMLTATVVAVVTAAQKSKLIEALTEHKNREFAEICRHEEVLREMANGNDRKELRLIEQASLVRRIDAKSFTEHLRNFVGLAVEIVCLNELEPLQIANSIERALIGAGWQVNRIIKDSIIEPGIIVALRRGKHSSRSDGRELAAKQLVDELAKTLEASAAVKFAENMSRGYVVRISIGEIPAAAKLRKRQDAKRAKNRLSFAA